MQSYNFPAPQKHTPAEILKKQRQAVLGELLIRTLLDTMPIWVLLLNRDRQLVMANQSMFKALNYNCDDSLVGLRPGEVLGCIYAEENPGGCGASEHCRTCGAITAFLIGQKDGVGEKECRMTVKVNNRLKSLDLCVHSAMFEIDEFIFHAFYLSDISHEKRRRILERIFFHDLLNTAGGLKGLTELLKMEVTGEQRELAETVYDVASRMINEIETQKNLLAAENGELKLDPIRIETYIIGKGIINRFSKQNLAEAKTIRLSDDYVNVDLVTDPWLLERVLSNLIKNAIEASEAGQKITLGCRTDKSGVSFSVHNEGVMDHEVQLQVFQRSFTTKGPGRGLGAYSVKLLTETYLNGAVFLDSSEEKGTTFTVTYPRDLTVSKS